jgi:hypothetical protein
VLTVPSTPAYMIDFRNYPEIECSSGCSSS